MNIDQELEKIIMKHNVDKHYPAYRTSGQACAYIKKWIRDLSDAEEAILFISMDERALHLTRNWSTGNNIDTLRISSVEELSEHIETIQNADKIYIVSYSRTIEILHWLWRHDFQAESVYDMLENQHIYLQMEFHRFFAPINIVPELDLNDLYPEHSADGSSFVLYEYYYQKRRLLHSQSGQDCERIREKLFFLSLCMKNFIGAKKILETMSGNTAYEKCWSDIEALLLKIEDTLQLNEQKHIIIYWLDALSYETAQTMDFFRERSDHSICFANAYTVTPFTLPTLKSIFCNIRQVDDLGYKIRHINMDDSPLLQDIMSHEYDFRIIGGDLIRFLDEKYNYSGESRMDAPCSEVFWNLTGQIIQSKQPTVYLVHAPLEIHIPCLSVQRDRFEKQYLHEARESQVRELNMQLSFYDNILGEGNDFYRIYMGDHGHSATAQFINYNLHIPFQIYYPAWKKQIWNKLFCFLDFPILLHQLLIGGDLNEMLWEREFVPVQDVNYYNFIRVKENLSQYGLNLLLYMAYKGVVTDEYIYLRFINGEELFHKWADGLYVPTLGGNIFQINPALLEELREKAGEFPKELDSDPMFINAKYIRTVYENVRRSVVKAMKKLEDKLFEYPDRSIALRTGGLHTLQLHALLSEDSRKKIGGIIDNNLLCPSKDLGYTVYSSGDYLPDTIKTILLSSYDNLEVLQTEAEKIYADYEIINIYRYWDECGYHFTKNFWSGLEADWEINSD